jgi:hypothetical protein
MKNYHILFLVLAVLLIQAVPLLAQEAAGPGLIDDLKGWKRSGQAAMPFLAFGSGGRMMAMADAGVAMIKDASALFYNPAGMAYVENRSVVLGSMSWLLDTNVHSGAFAMR